MEKIGIKTRIYRLSEKEIKLIKYLMADYQGIGNIQNKLKWIFARIIKQMLEAEMDEHLGYKKNSVDGNNFKNIRNGYGKKTLPAITTSTKRMSQCDIEDILREIYGSKISQ